MFYTRLFPKLIPVQVEAPVPLPKVAMVIVNTDGVPRPAPNILDQVAEDVDDEL